MMAEQRRRVKILDILVDVLTLDKAVLTIFQWVRERRKVYICVAPVSTVMTAVDNLEYRDIVNNAAMVTADGMPLVWASHVKGIKDLQRVCGPDLMMKICADSSLSLRHCFYGSTDEVLMMLQKKLQEQNPDIQIVGAYAPSFSTQRQQEDQVFIDQINQVRPDILWVGLGSPKQDYWMHQHRDILDVPVMIGVGAAFDFLAGIKPRAPQWMQRCGLEWLFRLSCEPRRLWRRYLVGNVRFMWEALKAMTGMRRKVRRS